MSDERRSAGSAVRATSPRSSSAAISFVAVGRWMRSRAASSLGVSGPWRSTEASAVFNDGLRPTVASWRRRRAVRATARRRCAASSVIGMVVAITN
jgi:hypothetical protein